MNNLEILDSHGPLDNQILLSLEKSWGFKFPKSYREFLLKYNGGCTKKNSFNFKNDLEDGSILHFIFGIHGEENYDLIYEYQNIFYNRIPSNCLPIGCDTFGNRILISIRGPDRGKIYFWDHEMEVEEGAEPDYSNLTLIDDTFDEFIANLYEFDDMDDDSD